MKHSAGVASVALVLAFLSPCQASYNVTRLLTGLEYPRGLWPVSDRVYFTETAGRNTVWGGKVCLDVFSLATAEKTVLVNNPENSDAVVVARSGSIYLTSYYHTVPGEQGKVSVVDPATNVETHMLDIGVASKDMYIDAQDNIFILGSSDLSTTPGIYYLAAGNYLNPSVLKSGLGRTWCISEHEGYVYYSDFYAIRRFPTPNGPSAVFLNKPVSSISFGGNFLYYVDFFDDKLRRVDLLSGTDEIMVTGLHSPIAVRYDTATDRLFFLEAGTTANHYKDGTLNMIDMRATVPAPGTAVTRLLTGLEYPRGLWPVSDRVYFTETAGHNTVWGGAVSLDVYSIPTGLKAVLVNNPENSDAVVVAGDGSIYLTSTSRFIPGEQGKVSMVNPATNVETHLLDIGIASEDMFIDAHNNILILGSSDLSTARSLYYLPAGNYLNPSVWKTGLGRVWCISEHEGYIYYSDFSAIRRFPATNGLIGVFLNKSVQSISFGGDFLYYVDYFGGVLGRVDLSSGTDEPMVVGLHSPIAVRYDTATDRLFFLEAGTTANHYKDGTLNMIDMRPTVPPPGTARLYDVDFSTPPHTVGLPPVADAGDPPRSKVSQVNMGAPTVVSHFEELTDQPLLFDTYGHVPQQIRLRLDDLPASRHYCLEVDIVIGSMQDQIGFTILLDVPQARRVDFWSDGAVRVWPSPVGTETIGHYTFGTKTHVRVEIDLETDRWNISLDDVLVYSESLEGATELRSIRFSTKTISSDGVRVAIDNIVVESSSAAATSP